MHSRQRYVVLGVLALAAGIGLIAIHGLQWLWSTLGLADPALGGVAELSLTHLLGGGLAAAGGVAALRFTRSRTLATEIVDELARVSWPARDETLHATMVVIVTVVVCSTYLGVLDALWLWVTDLVLGVHGGTAG